MKYLSMLYFFPYNLLITFVRKETTCVLSVLFNSLRQFNFLFGIQSQRQMLRINIFDLPKLCTDPTRLPGELPAKFTPHQVEVKLHPGEASLFSELPPGNGHGCLPAIEHNFVHALHHYFFHTAHAAHIISIHSLSFSRAL